MHVTDLSLFSKIDFARVALPSDRLTIKQLRERFPDKVGNVVDREGERLDVMWDAERLVVLLGYASVLGKEAVAEVERAVPDGDKHAYFHDLVKDLIHYGFADGPATAKQIMQGLEDAGADIAKEHLGRTHL